MTRSQITVLMDRAGGLARDTRAGCAPYSVKDVETIRGALVGLAEAGGLDPSNLPTRLEFHKAGVL